MDIYIEPLSLAEMACNTIMKKFSPINLPPKNHFHYHQGVLLSGFEKTYENTMKKEYLNYIKQWVDSLIDENGSFIGKYDTETLDDKQPATLLFKLLDLTNDKRYETVIHYVKSGIDEWPVCKEGGFWHMNKPGVENQMWLDGLYMAGEFLARYGERFNDTNCYDRFYAQAKLMWENIRDKETGLLYHAWDSSKVIDWSDEKSGCSSEFWGRAAGWFIVALTTALQYIPDTYEHKEELISYAKDYIQAFVKYQDSESGLWYQVLDKADGPNNWTESSCSALFLCGISMALKSGYVESDYKKNAKKAYEGLLNIIEEKDDGSIVLPKICVGTGVGDYEYYINRPTSENDLHGMGALILACNAYSEIVK